jgi:hypothetical protein
MPQVVECLLNKSKTLISNSTTAKNNDSVLCLSNSSTDGLLKAKESGTSPQKDRGHA